jgi:hypothetical protein
MRNYLEFDSGRDILEGVLVYRVQGKHVKSDEFVHDESKNIQLLIAWHEHTKGIDVSALLVEYDNELDEDKLRQLYQKVLAFTQCMD